MIIDYPGWNLNAPAFASGQVTDFSIGTDQIFVPLKKETLDYLQAYLICQSDKTITYDDIIQEWVNWQKKADEESK